MKNLLVNYFKSLNVEFDEQKRFSDCKNSKGSDMLPFDFYIPKYNTLIEYDGLHHFEPINGGAAKKNLNLHKKMMKLKIITVKRII